MCVSVTYVCVQIQTKTAATRCSSTLLSMTYVEELITHKHTQTHLHTHTRILSWNITYIHMNTQIYAHNIIYEDLMRVSQFLWSQTAFFFWQQSCIFIFAKDPWEFTKTSLHSPKNLHTVRIYTRTNTRTITRVHTFEFEEFIGSTKVFGR